MDRQTVYVGIDVERAYQKRRWGGRQPDGTMLELELEVGEYLVFMQHYLSEAMKELATQSGEDAALHDLRKVVALGVACFEHHGMPFREVLPANVINAVINGHDDQPA